MREPNSRSPIVCRVTDVPIDVPELARKSSVSWIRAGSETYPVWHEWVETDDGGAICVVGSVTGEGEQPIPDVVDGTMVTVLLRSKTDRALAASVSARVHIIGPGAVAWEPVTAALKAGRLNAPDLPTIVERWARDCRVLKLVPEGPVTPAAEVPDDHRRTLPRLS